MFAMYGHGVTLGCSGASRCRGVVRLGFDPKEHCRVWLRPSGVARDTREVWSPYESCRRWPILRRRVCYRRHVAGLLLHQDLGQRFRPGRRRPKLRVLHRRSEATGRGVSAAAQRSGPAARRRCRHGPAQCRRHRHHRPAQPGRGGPRRGCPGRRVQVVRPDGCSAYPPGTVVVVHAVPAMSWWQVVVLAVVQGVTEFLPVSSSGHLAIVSRVFFAGDAGASFTAVTQLGTEAAVLVYFARDIVRILKAWFSGLRAAAHRTADFWLGWYVIIGTIPICVLGLFFKDEIRSGVRNLWVIATALVVFSAVIALAERIGRQSRVAEQLTWRDAVVVGIAQTLALVPGVSRSGAPISAGLFLGLERELAARFGFLLAIPAVFASGLFSLPDAFRPVSEGMSATGPQLVVAIAIAFVVGLAAVAWFLRFLVRHSMYWFVGYRVAAGVAVLILLATGVVSAT